MSVWSQLLSSDKMHVVGKDRLDHIEAKTKLREEVL